MTTARYLSPAWHEQVLVLAQGVPEKPGATANVGYHVTGGPEGDIHYFMVVVDGRVREQALGDRDDLDVTLVSTYDDSVRVQRGELDANAAFMQGKVKVANGGRMGKLMALMPLTMSPDYKRISAEIRAITEF